jgi:hypothetical protein
VPATLQVPAAEGLGRGADLIRPEPNSPSLASVWQRAGTAWQVQQCRNPNREVAAGVSRSFAHSACFQTRNSSVPPINDRSPREARRVAYQARASAGADEAFAPKSQPHGGPPLGVTAHFMSVVRDAGRILVPTPGRLAHGGQPFRVDRMAYREGAELVARAVACGVGGGQSEKCTGRRSYPSWPTAAETVNGCLAAAGGCPSPSKIRSSATAASACPDRCSQTSTA